MYPTQVFTLTVCLVTWGQDVSGQQVIQQPVVQQFSTDTVVSVPDRGNLYLGGVGSAGAARSEYGPLPWGTAGGRFTSSSGLDVSVYIHDFEALDEALLSEPIRGIRQPDFRSRRAAAAWRSLKKDWRRD
jgi:hypothetical protein